MDEQFKKEDYFTRSLIKDAGLNKPSMDFKNMVMHKIATNAANSYQPLISKNIWWFLAITVMALTIGIYVYPLASTDLLGQWNLSERLNFNFTLPTVQISKITSYALGFLALILLEIPFLKRILMKQY